MVLNSRSTNAAVQTKLGPVTAIMLLLKKAPVAGTLWHAELAYRSRADVELNAPDSTSECTLLA